LQFPQSAHAAMDESQLEMFGEVVGFLSDPKAQVQGSALAGLLGYVDVPEFKQYVAENTRAVVRPTMRLMASEQREIAKAAFALLTNLSQNKAVGKCMVELKGFKRVLELLMTNYVLEGDAELTFLSCAVLANLSGHTYENPATTKAIEEQLGVTTEGAGQTPLEFLVACATQAPQEKGDPFLHLYNLLQNISNWASVRAALMSERTTLAYWNILASYMVSQRSRRKGVMGLFRNLASEPSCHPKLVESDLPWRMCCFLFDAEAKDLEGRDAVYKEIVENQIGFSADVSTRRLGAEVLGLLCTTKEGREGLRLINTYEVVRRWHLKEEDPEIKDALESIVPSVHYTEEELVAEGLDEPDPNRVYQIGNGLNPQPPEAVVEPAKVTLAEDHPARQDPSVDPSDLPLEGLFDRIEENGAK